MRAFLAALAIFNLSGGTLIAEPSMDLIASESFTFHPSVSTAVDFQTERSALGWGSFDLTAVPEVDEIRVDLVVGLPASEMRWRGCKRFEVVSQNARVSRSADWAGVPMSNGVYDAVRGRLTIEDVRDLASDEKSFAEVCGERVSFTDEARRALGRFAETFDEIALTCGESAPSPPLELAPDHDFFIEEPLGFPFPA